MIGWIIYYREAAEYNHKYIEFHIEEGNKLGLEVKLILIEELEFGVENNQLFLRYQGRKTNLPDFAICRAFHPLLSKQLEWMGVRVFNNSLVSEICNDKAKTYQYLAGTGIRMVDSSFYRNHQVQEMLPQLNKTAVIKAVDGHGGNQVFLLDHDKANTPEDILDGIGDSDVVIQPMINGMNQDLRVYVIGKEIIACVLRTAKEGFKSNFSLGGTVCLYQLSEEEISIVHGIIEQFDFGLVGIDFIIDKEGRLIFNEIEDIVGSRMLYQCSNINIVELYLKYIMNEMKR